MEAPLHRGRFHLRGNLSGQTRRFMQVQVHDGFGPLPIASGINQGKAHGFVKGDGGLFCIHNYEPAADIRHYLIGGDANCQLYQGFAKPLTLLPPVYGQAGNLDGRKEAIGIVRLVIGKNAICGVNLPANQRDIGHRLETVAFNGNMRLGKVLFVKELGLVLNEGFQGLKLRITKRKPGANVTGFYRTDDDGAIGHVQRACWG